MENKKIEFTLLESVDIYGSDRSYIFEKYGTKCAVTDFVILLGGYVSDCEYTNEGHELKNRAGVWMTKTLDGDGAWVVCEDGHKIPYAVNDSNGGIRPVLSGSLISEIFNNRMNSNNGIVEMEYGEYPQYIVSSELSITLEKLYTNGLINKTGKSYASSLHKWDAHLFKRISKDEYVDYIEYEYNEKKYIRFVGGANYTKDVLSDGTMIEKGTPYWIEVSPIKWIVDEIEGIVISKYIIFTGVPYNRYDLLVGFEKADIYKFMNEVLAEEIMPCIINKSKEIERLEKVLMDVEAEKARLFNIEAELNDRLRRIQIETGGEKTYVKQ